MPNTFYLRGLATLCLHLAQGMAYLLSLDFAAAERVLSEARTTVSVTNYHFLNLIVMGMLDCYGDAGGPV
ncbi:hypothetical protein KSX_91360 [Ktedonospora formicarum]|uniref:Uncharacterized protein n=1 Tax=Ktedonospora formicarum TaxID=2778364 RepID=A0A8J3IEN2_9CHLR|nr:hypothetical protein KSX_91360 [Ktedonospora formicarum]